MSEGHALLSASGSAKWLACAGSLALEAGIPNRSSSYADEGTAAHTLAAWCLESDTSPDPEAFRGRRIDVEGRATFEVGADLIEHVGTYVNNVLAFAEGHTLLVEQRVDYSESIGQPDAFGTSDAIIITTDGELQVHDLKYGRGERVDAEDNTQLMLYALGAIETFELAYDFDRVRLFIHQPRLGHLSEWGCSLEDLRSFKTKARIAAKLATDLLSSGDPAQYLQAGEKQCRWCRAKATCPALAADVRATVHMSSATPDDFEDLTVQDTDLLKAHNADSLASAMAKVDLIEQWCKAIRGEVEARLVEGKPVPGYKLVAGRKGARSWSDAAEAEAQLKSFRLKVEEMYDLSLISPTTAEKLAKAGTIGPRQWSKAQPLIRQSEGKPSVAPESDKRPAITVAAQPDDFEDLGADAGDLV